MRYAIIADGKVVNTVEAPAGWTDPDGRVLVSTDAAGKGDSYDGTTFTTPPRPPRAPTLQEREYAALTTQAQRTQYIARKLGLLPPEEPSE